ncbi:MAG: hypothetical protein KJ964_05815 [Verrucomicrobia bacterium]|nr:hypothetical protein [Verrucomicrobiota bacterium]MBU1735712.1 hypothetical protein [Verrucomicrobiota bacterium]MBU1856452.1 hypothetical protein [Verrucomicrobiota bacterium]
MQGIFRWSLRLALTAILLCTGGFCGFFAPQLYHHFVLFPKQAAAWNELAARRTPVAIKTGWNEYRGVLHSHSHLSHDSEMQFPEIAEALKKAHCQFIFLTDHVVDDKADYSLGWKGIHDDILFVQGFEMQAGFMPWGLPEGTVLSNNASPTELAKQIRQLGGVLCLGHCEEKRPWDIPEIDGMEIYNMHTDLLLDTITEKHARVEVLKEVLINMRSYPDQTLRSMFDWQTLAMLVQKWDEQGRHRKLTGIAGNDCHQDIGLRGIYTAQNTLLLLGTGSKDPRKKLREYKLNVFARLMLRLCFGPLVPDRQLFRVDLDPYERSARFINTHLLAKELTEPALLDAIRTGRAFIAFNMIADAGGFAYVAEGNGQQVTMGERIALTPGLKLWAEAPLPCRFTLVRDGKKVAEQEGKVFEYKVTTPGKYRIQADLPMPGEMTISSDVRISNITTPWILTNPIEVDAQE